MEVDFALLSDTAESVNGKLYMMGGAFDTIWAKEVPIVHPHLSFTMRLLFSPAELGRTHMMEVNMITEDGRKITTVGGPLKLGEKNKSLPKGWKQGFLTVLNFANTKFDEFGNYSFEIVVNNTSLKSIPLRIAKRVKVQI